MATTEVTFRCDFKEWVATGALLLSIGMVEFNTEELLIGHNYRQHNGNRICDIVECRPVQLPHVQHDQFIPTRGIVDVISVSGTATMDNFETISSDQA